MKLTFRNWENGYLFLYNNEQVAVGDYDGGEFVLLEQNGMNSFRNAMQAFTYLRNKYELLSDRMLDEKFIVRKNLERLNAALHKQ